LVIAMWRMCRHGPLDRSWLTATGVPFPSRTDPLHDTQCYPSEALCFSLWIELAYFLRIKKSGWVNYWFPKPGQTEPSEKWSYVKAVTIDGTPGLIRAGFYPN
jgi:hypothetical protein